MQRPQQPCGRGMGTVRGRSHFIWGRGGLLTVNAAEMHSLGARVYVVTTLSTAVTLVKE
jgi:hypothetical protein